MTRVRIIHESDSADSAGNADERAATPVVTFSTTVDGTMIEVSITLDAVTPYDKEYMNRE